jgi:hypothetical protein
MGHGSNTCPGWDLNDTLVMAGMTALVSLVRLPHLVTPYVINVDAINYIEGARAILAGDLREGLRLSHASLYPILTALIYPMLGDWVTAARVWSVGFGILTVAPYYWAARKILGRRPACIAVLCYALSPAILASSLDVIREPIAWFGFSLFLGMLIVAVRTNRWWHYLSCGVLALGCLSIRADALLLIPAGIIVALYTGLRSGKASKGLWNCAAVLLPAASVAIAVSALAPGSWKGIVASETASYGRQLESVLAGGSPGTRQEVQRLIAESPSPRVARFFSLAWEKRWVLTAWSLLEHWARAAYPIPFALMIAGMARGEPWRDRRWQVIAFLMTALLIMGYVRVLGAFSISKRHLVPLVLLGYLFTGPGVERVALLFERLWPKLATRTVAAAVLGMMAAVMLARDLQPIRSEKILRRQAGEWIGGLGVQHPTVVTEHRHIAFYAGGRSVTPEKFMEDPSQDAHFLAWEPKKGSSETEVLQRLKAIGWNATPLKEFRDERGAISLYGLTRSGPIGP